ncbi:VacJ family lipoprotein [Desulforhopalus vacuolatus]|nr:VacJ family lipoprotein [Desulforhopalus vacuolatus]
MTIERNKMRHRTFCIFALFVVLLAAGCAKNDQQNLNLEPPMYPISEYVNPDIDYPIDVYDPFEGFNRCMYTFNYYFDSYIFIPIVNGYEYVTPDYVERRIYHFVNNIFEFTNFTNNLLQLKFEEAGVTVLRFVINSTVGIAGLWDPATYMGLNLKYEDFGQTLGYYGVGDGPYLVLPVLGPSNLRDTTGLITDVVTFSLAGPPAWLDDDSATWIFTGITAINKRRYESFRYYQTGSPFEYEMIRMLYTAKREIMVDN